MHCDCLHVFSGHPPLLHLVDENFDLVSVRSYSSVEQLAVEELVKMRALVALSNLQVRPLSGPVPSLYAGEQAVFAVNPKESHLQEAMTCLKTFVQVNESDFKLLFLNTIKECFLMSFVVAY